MITLNLLPDIKKEYLKAKRTKQFITMIAFGVGAAAVAATALMAIYVLGVQRLQINSSQGSIDESVRVLNESEDLAKIVTIQNQLTALPAIEDTTVAASRLFGYVSTITPNEITLTQLRIDFENSGVELRGNGESFKAVNTFVDTLKNATFTYADATGSSLAFSSVVLDTITADDEAGFEIIFLYNPQIFDPNIEGVKLSVPNITSTRSQTEKPKSLFDTQETEQ